ncbi:MAG: IclR family transcriptional regulator [Acidimicrobiia bacterium]
MSESPYEVRAVVRALDVLDALQEAPDGATLQELAERAGLPKSSAFRYLSTLEARGYVERDSSNGTYRFGRALLPARTLHLDVLATRARPILEALRDRFEETVNLGVLEGNRVAYLVILESPRAMRFAARAGDRDPLHSTALGKAIASLLDEEVVRTILAAEGMPQRTLRTVTDPDALIRELKEIAERGHALDDRENEEDGRCVGVPIPGTPVPAAISLSAPAGRFTMEDVEEVAAALQEAARRIAREALPFLREFRTAGGLFLTQEASEP